MKKELEEKIKEQKFKDFKDYLIEEKKLTPKNYGWICPVCSCGNSPYTSNCNNCISKQKITFDC